MSQAKRTNLTALLIVVYNILIAFFWSDFVYLFNLSFIGQMIFTQIICFIVPLIFYFIITKKPVKETLRLNPLGLKNAILIILIVVFLDPATSLLSALTSLFFSNNVSSMLAALSNTPFVLVLFATAVMPSICEELVFRGIIFSGYKNLKLPKAMLLSGLIFGIMHLDGQQLLYAIFCGIIFCYFVYKTNSIFSSILAHFFFNASSSIISRISYNEAMAQGIDIYSQTITNEELISTITMLSGVVLFSIPILYFLFKLFNKANIRNTAELDYEGEEDISVYNPLHGTEDAAISMPIIILIIIYVLLVFILPYSSF